ncbi:hypothetical protein GQ53DRAFT_795573 [Thozetella sp. PMI_491]|nr:hypothetical protein GQ53DRAFT_795573 [Thozetella sp. PMI_491]
MAAMSTAHTTTTLTPPASSHGAGYSWNISSGHTENFSHDSKTQSHENTHPSGRPPLTSQNGNSAGFGAANPSLEPLSKKQSNGDGSFEMRGRNPEAAYLSPTRQNDPKAHGINETDSPADSLLDRSANDTFSNNSPNDESSKWIHRDKLARIENEELQAAGIVLPRPRERARSKSQNRSNRRDPSRDGYGRTEAASRSRKNSVAIEPRTPDAAAVPSWDLRLPEEILTEGDGYWISNNGGKGVSKIPVAKTSPAPIPSEHLERDRLLIRKRDSSPDEDTTISYPKTRARSGSTGTALAKTTTNGSTTTGTKKPESPPKGNNTSPTKKATGVRKTTGPKPANGAAGRPRTRGGPSKDSTSTGGATTRPSTRSGERELSPTTSKQMEGEPPWMVSAFRPDPRLPPEQQLLPTVARRLQQEKWEREGKVSSVYDKEFRPLSEEFLKPPETIDKATAEKEKEPEMESHPDWPLKPERSPTLPTRTGSYSTMPKISDKHNISPIPSPRTPVAPPQAASVVRLPDAAAEEPEPKKGSCGCCIVM